MRKLLYLIPLALLLGLLGYNYFAGGDSGRALLARAIEAHGGESRFDRTRTGFTKGKGNELVPHDMPFTWEETFQLPHRLKSVIRKQWLGSQTHIYADGKHRVFREKEEMSVIDLEEAGENIESMPDILGRLVTAWRLKGQVTPLADTVVRGRQAAGIEIDTPGHPRLQLYFDKQTYRLVKMTKEKALPDKGTVLVELYCSAYKDVDGVAVPGSISVYQDGRPFIELTIHEVKFVEKIDDSHFARP